MENNEELLINWNWNLMLLLFGIPVLCLVSWRRTDIYFYTNSCGVSASVGRGVKHFEIKLYAPTWSVIVRTKVVGDGLKHVLGYCKEEILKLD